MVPLLLINLVLILGQIRIKSQITESSKLYMNEWMMKTHITLFSVMTVWMIGVFTLELKVDEKNDK